jgi:hypothetical protein
VTPAAERPASAKSPASAESRASEEPAASLTLLVAGESVFTRSARANLEQLISDGVTDAVHVRVIDVLSEPDYALRYRAFCTPALIVETPTATTTLVGDLRDPTQLRLLLAAA